MKKTALLSLWFWAFSFALYAQSIPTPTDFLGYSLGEKFTYHHKMQAYFEKVASQSAQVQLIPYGETYERRPLFVAVVSSEENLKNMDEIRKNNLLNTGLATGTNTGKNLPIVWLSYNVHGNESVGMEAAIETLHSLASGARPEIKDWLENVVIILDPCINPDGRDRYANWYNQVSNLTPNPDPNSLEHHEPWLTGRSNHYLFDLNRDWAWQTQVESQQRVKLYQDWMPHVHVDFHEMGVNSPYFFAPAAAPFHEVITDWQKEFQHFVGQNHAKYFDQNAWLYYTREVFDLLYPSYGDTYPIFNGSMGFTYEQGGSGAGGLAVTKAEGDQLTLSDRIAHHHTTSLSTIEVAYERREKLLTEFKTYFAEAANNPVGNYKSYVIKGDNSKAALQAFLSLLDKQQIQYAHPSSTGRNYQGFDYFENRNRSFQLQENDIVISAYQPLSRLVKVLLEPQTQLQDSLTYDLTAWALPYVYGLEAYATSSQLEGDFSKKINLQQADNQPITEGVYAFVSAWEDVQDARFLASLLKNKIKVRFAHKDFKVEGKRFKRGALIIPKANNEHLKTDFEQKITDLAKAAQQAIVPVKTGFAEEGKDLGANEVLFLKAPKVAIVRGDGISTLAFGEVWHFFEQDLNYPVSILHSRYLQSVNLSKFDVLILPSGNYSKFNDKLINYTKQGGRVIALERAMNVFARKNKTNLAENSDILRKTLKKEREAKQKASIKSDDRLQRYEDQERAGLSEYVAGSIYKVHLDTSHPLAFGLGDQFYLMKRRSSVYPYLSEGAWNVGVFKKDSYVSGFVGSKLKTQIENSLAIGVEHYGRGELIYLSDSPIFRGFWHGGKLLLSNAVFLQF